MRESHQIANDDRPVFVISEANRPGFAEYAEENSCSVVEEHHRTCEAKNQQCKVEIWGKNRGTILGCHERSGFSNHVRDAKKVPTP